MNSFISFSIPGFNGSEDCAALEQLLEGYDQQDQDQVSEVCNLPLFKYMDNDVSRQFLWIFLIILLLVQVEIHFFFFLVEENKKGRVHVFTVICSVILPCACEH